ncbi:hypothetical protein HK097_008876 [Rhizophlyctis rosea]|uniref:mannan endo-1,4-beta-mannosidase n=1 Tax=Rhizophlyctis rosea TaxID=64517 RepID=A0AAD5X4A4_9FUNG|nr:hypothetical protein HK097_008876 [Rhizophlyctis rosea]
MVSPSPTASSIWTRPTFPTGTTFVNSGSKCGVSNNGAACNVDLCCGLPLNTPDYFCGNAAKHCGKDRCNGAFGSCWTNATDISTPTAPIPLSIGRITRKGAMLYDGTKPFRFLSINVPGFLLTEDREIAPKVWVNPTSYEQNDAALSINVLEGRVIRTYTLGVGPQHHITGIRAYNEAAFRAMDEAIAAAGRNGVRVIIPLINSKLSVLMVICEDCLFKMIMFCPDHFPSQPISPNWLYGDYGRFTELYGLPLNSFFNSTVVRDGFKHLITFLLTRTNTVTGWKYADDPTILAIETGNELGGREADGPAPPGEWTVDIAQHIKSLAPNVLVMDATFGGNARWNATALASPYVDIFTSHLYGEDPNLINTDGNVAARNNKAYIVGEFGLTETISRYTAYMNTIIANTNVTGGLTWSLRYHARDGGFYTHSEGYGNFYSYHVPGFPANFTNQWGTEEASIIPTLRSKALQITGQSTSKAYPAPPAPQMIQGDATITPRNLRWRGSAWGASYNIYRGTRASNGSISWGSSPIATGVKDNVRFGRRIYTDTSAVRGTQYYYSVRAVSVSGGLSTYSDILGPVREP